MGVSVSVCVGLCRGDIDIVCRGVSVSVGGGRLCSMTRG